MKTLFILSAYPCRKQISCIFTFLFGLILFANLTACSEQNDDFSCPEAMDDATLLASQLKLLKTRANNATNTILVTTSTAVSFTVEKNSQIVIDWGDGNSDIDVFSHTYTDNLPVHTITFNGTQDAIQKLDCQKQEIIFLDVIKSTALQELNCSFNRITSLNLTNNLNLNIINCCFNALSELHVSSNKKVTVLRCEENRLQKLDVSSNTLLKELVCHNNRLDSINTSNNTELYYFVCSHNLIKQLNVSANSKLEVLQFINNQLTSIDLSSNLLLRELWCSDNRLVKLTLPISSSLQTLSCENNQLNELILPTNYPDLTYVYCSNNPFELDQDPNIAFQNILNLLNSLPMKEQDYVSYIFISETPDKELFKTIAARKKWVLNVV